MHYHDSTSHTYESVRMPHFLDWASQPAAFKRYPHFYQRFPFSSLPLREFWGLLAGITLRRQHGEQEAHLRTIPSAGGLFPVELYVQVRGVRGLLDGIYHYEAVTESLVLLHPVDRDGVEPWLGLRRFSGLLFLVSSPWFRSAWKYGLRSFRYCHLDGGHLLGALEAACGVEDRPFAVMTGFDRRGLAERFGMEQKEFVLAAALSGEEGEKEVRPLSLALPHVLPTDYHESWPEMEEIYEETLRSEFVSGRALPSPYEKEGLKEAILRRRSIRAFRREPMEGVDLERVFALLKAPLACEQDPRVNLYSVVSSRVRGVSPGLYRNGELLREGDFMEQAGYLCLEQRLGSDGGATLFLTGRSDDYPALMLKAGVLGQRLYVEATRLGLGASGIGAFYDGEVQKFLDTKEWILYALALGR